MLKKIIKRIIPKKIKRIYRDKQLKLIKANIRNTECKYKVYNDDSEKLGGKIAVVTGGSGAIGSAICFKLAMEGANVIICGRNKEALDSVKKQIIDNNGKSETMELDVTDYDDISKKMEDVYQKYGSIDILVNNAGGSARSRHNKIENQDINVIDDVLNVNLRGTIYTCKAVSK